MFSHQLFSFEEMLRYSRHIILPEVGPLGQEKLGKAKVLIVGAGGLGSPVALYLAAAGVGKLGLIDFDRVELSNLQRQVVHTKERIGMLKVDSATVAIKALNPHVEVEKMAFALGEENVLKIVSGYDVVVDGTDNFTTRYLVNDACVLLSKPYVYGSIYRFEGHVSVFGMKNQPCYRCLFPKPPKAGLAPSCSEAGVLGVLAGTIGTLQATETLKLLLGIGEPLAGMLLVYDALGMHVRNLNATPDQACPVCGENPTITSPKAYEIFCADDLESGCLGISPKEFITRQEQGACVQILDIREPHQRLLGGLKGAVICELESLEKSLQTLDPAVSCVVVCQRGVRSKEAIGSLRAMGYKGELLNLEGGVLGLAQALI